MMDRRITDGPSLHGFQAGELSLLRGHMNEWELSLEDVIRRSTPTPEEQIADMEDQIVTLQARIDFIRDQK